MDYFVETYDGEEVGHCYGSLYVFDDTQRSVGVLGRFGIGAPTTAMLMEELIVDGVEAFLSIGIAGSLDDSIEMGEFVVCDEAIRDEPFHVGPSWTTDAIYRETKLEIER